MKIDPIEHNLYELYGRVAEMGGYPMKGAGPLKEAGPFRSFSQPGVTWPDMTFIAEGTGAVGVGTSAFGGGTIGELARLIREEGWSRTLILGQRWLDGLTQGELRANGFLPVTQWTNMVFPPDKMNSPGGTMAVAEVRDEAALSDWMGVVEKVLFNSRALPEDIFFKGVKSNIFRLLTVYYEGKAAATALIFLGEVPGVYMVATAPAYRRKGLARALMDRARAVVLAAGYKELVLHSTKEGLEFYLSLGLEAKEKMTLYYLRK